MTPYTVILRTDQLSEEDWLNARRHGIGASDAAATVGLSPFQSPYSLYENKVEGYDSFGGNPPGYVRFGKRIERFIAEEWARDEGYELAGTRILAQSLSHPFMLCTPDDEIKGGKEGVEVKNAGAYKEREWDEGIPDYIALQCLHSIHVMGWQRCHVPVLFGGNNLRTFVVERDEKEIEALIAAEAAFWKLVEDRTPPDVDASEMTLNALKWEYRESDPEKVVEVDDYGLALCSTLADNRAMASMYEKNAKGIESQIRALLGAAELGLHEGSPVVTLKPQTRKAYTVEEKTFRVLRFPKVKGEE